MDLGIHAFCVCSAEHHSAITKCYPQLFNWCLWYLIVIQTTVAGPGYTDLLYSQIRIRGHLQTKHVSKIVSTVKKCLGRTWLVCFLNSPKNCEIIYFLNFWTIVSKHFSTGLEIYIYVFLFPLFVILLFEQSLSSPGRLSPHPLILCNKKCRQSSPPGWKAVPPSDLNQPMYFKFFRQHWASEWARVPPDPRRHHQGPPANLGSTTLVQIILNFEGCHKIYSTF